MAECSSWGINSLTFLAIPRCRLSLLLQPESAVGAELQVLSQKGLGVGKDPVSAKRPWEGYHSILCLHKNDRRLDQL